MNISLAFNVEDLVSYRGTFEPLSLSTSVLASQLALPLHQWDEIEVVLDDEYFVSPIMVFSNFLLNGKESLILMPFSSLWISFMTWHLPF